MTPQLQFAIGLFKWVELGVSLPVHIMFGDALTGVHRRRPRTRTTALSFSGQYVGDIGFHVKARFLNTSKYPVGLGLLFSLYAPSGDAQEVPRRGPGHAAARAHRRQGVRPLAPLQDGAQRRRAHPSVDALVHRQRHDARRRARRRRRHGLLRAVDDARRRRPAPPRCGTQQTRSLGSQLTYGLGVSYAIVPQRFDLVGEAFGYADVDRRRRRRARSRVCSRPRSTSRSKSYFEIGGGAGPLAALGRQAA